MPFKDSVGAEWVFLPFEALRHPARQAALCAEGRSNAGPWQSAHQWGLAVDFVPQAVASLGKWTWQAYPEVWAHLATCAQQHGLSVPLSWDKAHVEFPGFRQLLKAVSRIDPAR